MVDGSAANFQPGDAIFFPRRFAASTIGGCELSRMECRVVFLYFAGGELLPGFQRKYMDVPVRVWDVSLVQFTESGCAKNASLCLGGKDPDPGEGIHGTNCRGVGNRWTQTQILHREERSNSKCLSLRAQRISYYSIFFLIFVISVVFSANIDSPLLLCFGLQYLVLFFN